MFFAKVLEIVRARGIVSREVRIIEAKIKVRFWDVRFVI